MKQFLDFTFYGIPDFKSNQLNPSFVFYVVTYESRD